MINENSTFGGFLTDIGEAKQANANALGQPWKLTHMLLGDANDTDPVPQPSQTALIHQVYRAAINQLFIDPANPAILIAELVLPPNIGGWWIRELGLEDEDGDFVAVANCPPSYKPLLAQGSGRNQVVRMHLIVSNTANVELKIDPSVVFATRKYVDDGDSTVAQGAANALQEHAEADEAHAAHQISIKHIAQALDAETVQQALAGIGAFAADGYQNIAVFDEAGATEWDVPKVLRLGLRKAHVTVIGGGGGGRARSDSPYWGGGGAGGIAMGIISLDDVDEVAVTVGAGGEGGISEPEFGHGSAGGSSSFGTYMSATGGTTGINFGAGGASGLGVGGQVNAGLGRGHNGKVDIADGVRYAGGNGGGIGGGSGANTPLDNDVVEEATDGVFPGAGGGGGAVNGGRAGAGAPGIVIVRW